MFVVIWRVGNQNWHIEDKLWPTRKHAEMAAELFKVDRPDFDVDTCEIVVASGKEVAA